MRNEITIRELLPSDVTEEYVSWLNDPEINKYLECRYMTHTIESTIKYVENMYNSKDNILFGIFHKDKHIGNVKLGDIHHVYKRCFHSVFLSKEYWGSGAVLIAGILAEEFAFKKLCLHKIYSGIYATNKAAMAASMRMGWKKVGIYKDHAVDANGNYIDWYIVEKINPYEEN